MRFPLPRSLSAQTLAVLLVGLAVSHAIGIAIYALDRSETVLTDEAVDVAERVAGTVGLLQRLPREWRGDIVHAVDSRAFHVWLDGDPAATGPGADEDLAEAASRFLQEQLDARLASELRVRFLAGAGVPGAEPPSAAGRLIGLFTGADRSDRLVVSVRLDGGQWLNFVAALPRGGGFWPGIAAGYILFLALGVGALTMWLVRRVTAPLSAFALAADRLGKNIRAEPLPERGPTEVVQASRALNEMQERLTRLVENRTQMLAAISHDLRTPITLLRLRAELMAEGEERSKVLATLDEMETMIDSVLQFAKATFHDEPQRQVELSALVASICDDMADAGLRVAFEPADAVPVLCRRIALKRALTNLIDNAVAYGGSASVSLVQEPEGVAVRVEDRGPGIPPDQLERIFLPFFRLDAARTPGRGGVGLGLSIAQAIVHAHGGLLRLENRPEGGLRTSVILPR